MSGTGKNEWTPQDTEATRGPSVRRVIIIVSVVLLVWVGFSYWAMEYGQTGEVLFADKSRGPYNTVEVTNDVAPIIYFVPCDDRACQELPEGAHRGDFNQVTEGHSQALRVTRSKETTVTYGVFDENRRLTGCLEFVSTKVEVGVIHKTVSEIATSCGIAQSAAPTAS